MERRERNYYAYIVASRSHTLYCGVTNSIHRRVEEHRDGTFEGFSATYNCNRLVWFEHFQYVPNAIAREKQIKKWGREKKTMMIERSNPSWTDLSESGRRRSLRYASLRSGWQDVMRW